MLSNGKSSMAPKDEITLKSFGIFYVAVIISVPCTLLIIIKDQAIINKITQYGVYAIYIYLLFIIFVFIQNIALGNMSEGIKKVPLFSLDIGHLAGTCSLAFTLHTAFIPILKADKKFKKNGKINLKYSYIGGFLVYFVIGALGGLGIVGRKAYINPPQSITEFFNPTDIPPVIVEAIYFCNLITVLPCFFGIFRSRFLKFIYENEEITRKSENYAGDILSANGAISCFFIVYLIPIFLHLKCYHGESHIIQSIRKKSIDAGFVKPDKILIDDALINTQSSVDDEREDIVCYQEVCNDHKDIDKYPKAIRLVAYGFMFSIGLMIFLYGLYNLFIRDSEKAQTGRLPGQEQLTYDGEIQTQN